MSAELKNARLKLKRADDLIKDADKLILQYFALPLINFRVQDPITKQAIIKIKFDGPLPEMLPVVVGDAISNMKAALDYLIVQLALKKGLDGTKFQFLARKDRTEFMKVISGKPWNQLDAAHITALKALRPYKGGDDFLYAFVSIRNTDIHNDLIMIPVPSVNSFQIENFQSQGATLPQIGPGDLLNGVEIFRIIPGGNVRFGRYKMEGHLAFGNEGGLKDYAVWDGLVRMHKLATDIIDDFERKFFNN